MDMQLTRSLKPILSLEEIVLPYSFIPPVNIDLCVNAKKVLLKKGEEAVLDAGQFEVLLTSEYGKYLT